MNKLDFIRGHLPSSWVHVTFTKKDGSERKMICTTSLSLIPLSDHPKPKPVEEDEDFAVSKPKNHDLFTVYEKDKGWRSFNGTSVTNAFVMGD